MRKEALLLLVGLAYIAIALGQNCFCADYGRCKFIEGEEGVCSCRIVAEFGEISTSETDEKCVDQINPEACTRKLKNCKTQYKSNFIFACDDDVQAYTCTSTAGRDLSLPKPTPSQPSPSPRSPSPPSPSPPGGPPSGPTGTTSQPTSQTTTTRTPSTATSTAQLPTALAAAADGEYPAYLISSTNRCPQNYTWISDEDECEHAVPNAVRGNFETDETTSKWPPGCHIKANVEGGEDPVFHFNNWFDHDTGERYSGGFDEGHPVCKKDSNGKSNSSSKTSSNDDDYSDIPDTAPQVKENLPPTRTLPTTTSTSMTTATTSASISSTSSTSSPSSTPSIPDATPARSAEAIGSNGTVNGRFGAVPPGTGNGVDPFGPPSGGNGEAGDGGGSSSDGAKSSGKTVAGIIIAFAVLAVTGGVAYARFGVGRREIARAGNDMVITDNPAFATGMRDQESRAAHAAAEAAGGGWQGGAMQGRLPTVPLITNVLYKSADEQEGPRRAASLPDPSLEYATANHVLSSMGTGFPPHMTHDYEEVQELEQVDYAVVVENDDVGVPSSSPSAGAAAAGGYEVTSFALAQMKSASNRAAQNNTATSTNSTFYNAGVGVPSMYNANAPPPAAAAAAGTYEYEVANIAPPSQVFAASNSARGAGSSAGAYEYEATQLSGIQERNSFHNTGAQHTVDEDEERQTIRDLEFVPSSPGVFGSKRGTSFC